MKKLQIEVGKQYHIDSYNVSQYEAKRVVDNVTVLEQKIIHARNIMVYSPYLNANVLVPRAELKSIE